MNLRCHVVKSSQLCVEFSLAISTFYGGSKAKVCYFQIVILVEQNILWLKVSVSHALVMAILQTQHELVEIVPGYRLLEPARVGNIVKDLSSLSQL